MKFFFDNSENERITAGIEGQLNKALQKSIESNNRDLFFMIDGFILKITSLSIEKRDISLFKNFIVLPVFYYQTSFNKFKSNTILQENHTIFSERASIRIKEIITFGIKYRFKSSSSLEEKKELNQFYYWGFYGFNKLLYRIIINKDWSQIKYAANEFDLIFFGYSDSTYKLRADLRFRKTSIRNPANKQEIAKLELDLEVESRLETLFRLSKLGLIFWVYYLIKSQYLTNEEAEKVIPFIDNEHLIRHDVSLLDDILFFRKHHTLDFLGWEEWDFEERLSGQSYSPPSVYNWATFGFVVYALKKGFFINPYDEISPSDVEILFIDIKKYCEEIIINKDLWISVIGVSNEEELNQKIAEFIKSLQNFKRLKVSGKEREISNTPLSDANINNFRLEVGTRWREATSIHNIFKAFGNISLITSKDIELLRIGFRTFFEKGKVLFIDSEHYQHIYGVGDWGSKIGIWEDEAFYESIFNQRENLSEVKSVLQAIEEGITKLVALKFKPSLIILASEFWHDYELNDSKKFSNRNLAEIKAILNLPENINVIGTFESIPILISTNILMDNRVVVSDFSAAFHMRHRQNSDWFEDELQIDVLEVTDDEAEIKFNKSPEKWSVDTDGNNISKEEALILIKNSVILDIWVFEDFKVIKQEAFYFFQVSNQSN